MLRSPSSVTALVIAPSLAIAVAVTFLLNLGAASAASSVEPIKVAGNTTPIVGVDQRLPSLGTTSYFTAGPGFADEIESYHDSGAYAADQQAVATAAGQFLGPWLASTCGDTSAAMCRPAVIFDIDETLITDYALYAANGFTLPDRIWRTSIIKCSSAAIASTRDLLWAAQKEGVAVFLISGRKESARIPTEACLRKRGVTGWQELILKSPATQSLSNGAYKTKARAGIEARGWRIAYTIGDQLSDLTGGHAAQGFLLPNPMYHVG